MKTRKDFLLASTLAASLTAACSSQQRVATASSPATRSGEDPLLEFDVGRFNQLTSRGAAHRHCFGIGRVGGGEGLYAMNNVYTTYDRILSASLDQVFLAGVLYHGAPVTMAFNDTVWNEVLIPAIPKLDPELRADFETVRITSGNPFFYHPRNSNGEDASIESLVDRGSLFFVCNDATFQLAAVVAAGLRVPSQVVYEAFTGGLVSGASFVPTGVWAIGALQEAHFTYLQATI